MSDKLGTYLVATAQSESGPSEQQLGNSKYFNVTIRNDRQVMRNLYMNNGIQVQE